MFDFLRRNVAAAGVGNVSLVEAACGGRNGEATLYRRGPEAMDSLYCRDNYRSVFRPVAHVSVLSLDALLGRCEVGNCALLKLDCEGAEYEILFNARPDTLRRVAAISMEYHVGLNPHVPQELETFLDFHGFKVRRLPLLDEEGGYLYAARGT